MVMVVVVVVGVNFLDALFDLTECRRQSNPSILRSWPSVATRLQHSGDVNMMSLDDAHESSCETAACVWRYQTIRWRSGVARAQSWVKIYEVIYHLDSPSLFSPNVVQSGRVTVAVPVLESQNRTEAVLLATVVSALISVNEITAPLPATRSQSSKKSQSSHARW